MSKRKASSKKESSKEMKSAKSAAGAVIKLVHGANWSTYNKNAKIVAEKLREAFPENTVEISKGAKNSFDVIIDGEKKWNGLEKGPPRTLKWAVADILAAVKKD